jgi:hypothetical protein
MISIFIPHILTAMRLPAAATPFLGGALPWGGFNGGGYMFVPLGWLGIFGSLGVFFLLG